MAENRCWELSQKLEHPSTTLLLSTFACLNFLNCMSKLCGKTLWAFVYIVEKVWQFSCRRNLSYTDYCLLCCPVTPTSLPSEEIFILLSIELLTLPDFSGICKSKKAGCCFVIDQVLGHSTCCCQFVAEKVLPSAGEKKIHSGSCSCNYSSSCISYSLVSLLFQYFIIITINFEV